ncbi:MAG: DUF3427 domain-containing protein [Verrucomicrobiales bacterium]
MNSEREPENISALESAVRDGFLEKSSIGRGPLSPALISNGRGSTVEHSLVAGLRASESFVFSVAFITSSAIAQLKQHFLDFNGDGTIVTSDFLMFNQPDAFRELLRLQERAGISVMRHPASGFHPKGYIFRGREHLTAMIGSSNLTSQALSRNYEWNLRVAAANESSLAFDLEQALSEQLAESLPITPDWLDQYAAAFEEIGSSTASRNSSRPDSSSKLQPNTMQQEALRALAQVRQDGAKRAVIVSATGTGKTILSALDVRASAPGRFLFIVHREQIVDRTITEFSRVLAEPTTAFGKLTGSSKDFNSKYLFATIQTLSQEEVLRQFDAGTFNYIVIDEAHRAAANTYERVINHFSPDFLLGMTATPERMDGFNVFELFDYNVPYEIRLNRALEADMLAPFHYYGVCDVEFEDGTTTDDLTSLARLASEERVVHILRAIETYGHAGQAPKGLIFCSRKDEAYELSRELNRSFLNGKQLRTVALTGDDPTSEREAQVRNLQSGTIDYILTVDIFNEGVDVPEINQIVMLRQTQSPVVFVQQLGRGLRLAEGKEYVVVIDFIANYANNFMIPIALFGDETLNRESLREKLNETVDAGSIPGLSSVSFDEVSRERVLQSITRTRLDSLSNLKASLVSMRNRVGKTPTLFDFYRFEAVDPLLLATKQKHYPELLEKLLGERHDFSASETQALQLITHEVFAIKRPHEVFLLDELLQRGSIELVKLSELFERRGLISSPSIVSTVVDSLSLRGFSEGAVARYGAGILEEGGGQITLRSSFVDSMKTTPTFRSAVWDIVRTGKRLLLDRYGADRLFAPGLQYSRYEVAHILGWPRKTSSTIYGVKVDTALRVGAIFVTLEKASDVSASTAYQDRLLDESTMRWFSKSNRNLASKDVAPIVANTVDLHVFVKKDDAEGANHYYLGMAKSQDCTETAMTGGEGETIPVVTMLLRFDEPISQGLFDYFAPALPLSARS